MLTDKKTFSRIFWLETVILFLITPFLLFPEVSTMGTFFSLIFVAILWIFPKPISTWPFLPKTPISNSLLLLMVMLIMGIFVSVDFALTMPKATGLLLGISVWRFLAVFASDRRFLNWCVLGFVVIGLGFVAFGILNANWLAKIPAINGLVRQLPGVSLLLPGGPVSGVHTNQIASTILIWLPLLISGLLGWRSIQDDSRFVSVLIVLTVMGVGLLLLTQSRSGYIGMAGTLMFIFFIWRQQMPVRSTPRKRITAAILVMLFASMMGVILLWSQIVQTWQDPNQNPVVGDFGAVGFRLEIWQWGIIALTDFPFSGIGLGTFRQMVRRLYPVDILPGYDIAHAHNIFLQTALDLGILGLIAYISMLLIVGWMAWEVGKKDESLRPFSLGLLSGIVALHLFGMTDALALGAKPGLLFWMALGLITAMHQIVTSENNPT